MYVRYSVVFGPLTKHALVNVVSKTYYQLTFIYKILKKKSHSQAKFESTFLTEIIIIQINLQFKNTF
jgi:hypothetical protein